MHKNNLLLLFFIIGSLLIYFTFNKIKIEKIDSYKNKEFLLKTIDSRNYLKILIDEKKNATLTIALSLSNNSCVINTLKQNNPNLIDLKAISQKLNKNTNYKNVWFQVISKDGSLLTRSWTDKIDKDFLSKRVDIQEFLKNPKITTKISVGEFDMNFKATIPIYDNNKNFIGIFETITHFNSIYEQLSKKNIDSVILIDKKYKNNITKPFSNTFIDNYCLANIDANTDILNHLKKEGVENHMQTILQDTVHYKKELNTLSSYYRLDGMKDEAMGHFFLFYHLDSFNLSIINDIELNYDLYMFFSIFILSIMTYFFYTHRSYQKIKKYQKTIILILIIIFIFLSSILYLLFEVKLNSDIKYHKTTLKQRVIQKYNLLYGQNKKFANHIFNQHINKKKIIKLFKDKKREELFNILKDDFDHFVSEFHIKQIHFHLKDSTSFLRLYLPNKFGDSLLDIRPSINFVNRYKKEFDGFECGKSFNGFRYIYPIYDDNKNHIGSVEISFTAHTFIKSFSDIFNEKANLLINTELLNKKLFKDKQSNFIKSPVPKFSFDKYVISKIKDGSKYNKKTKLEFEEVSKNILKGKPFIMHFKDAEELNIFIPLVNKLSNDIEGSINIIHNDRYIKDKTDDFKLLMIIIILILAFIMLIIYKEIISKHILNKILQKNQKVLNSQKSLIIITNGIEIFESNKTLLNFFGYETLYEFKNNHNCICDMFKEEKGKNYVQKQMGDKSWYRYILEKNSKENRIMMTDINNKKHIFRIDHQEYDSYHKSEIFTFVDITQIETLNYSLIQKAQEAEDLTKIKSEFLANMSHEIRTPMNGIIGMSHLALLSKLDTKQKHYVQKIDDSAKSLLGIINDILDFSKIEAGKLTIDKIDFDLFETVDKVIDLISFKAHDKNLELIVSYDREVGNRFYGDKLRISQILTNLLGNAIKFTDVGEVGIYISKIDKDRVRFEVRDTGIGLSQKAQAKLFKSFSQADGSITRKYGGTGLGLTISKQLTELMDGKIWVESTLGEGSSFIFEIKLEDKNFTHKEFTHFKNKKILIVDDNKSWHEILTNSLEEFKIEVVDCVSSGNEAIETLINCHHGQYDLILMDWNMPYLNGIDTTQKIHKICDERNTKHLPTIVMISAFRQESIVKSAKEVGIDIFLQKPVNPSILNNVLRSIFLKNIDINYTNPNQNKIKKSNMETLSGSKILLVEDNITNQEIIIGLLDDSGIKIDIASNGKEGVNMFEQDSYELILMDIQMPIMNGYEATRKIREKDKNIPIIALSANAMQKDRDRTLKEGMNAHLNKPIVVEELYKTLLQYISKKKDISISKEKIDKDDIEIPNFKTIDTKLGLNYLNNNKKLYIKILKDFVTDYKNINCEKLNDDEFKRVIHTIKGLSASFGAVLLNDISSKIDKTEDKSLLPQLKEELQNVINEIENNIKKDILVKKKDIKESMSLEKRNELFLELKDAIDSEMPNECKEIILKINNYQLLAKDEILYDKIRKLINRYQFEEAGELLSEDKE